MLILLSSGFHIKQIYVFFLRNILFSHISFKTGSTEAPFGLQGQRDYHSPNPKLMILLMWCVQL
jgi:hypothetical protein